MTISFKFYGTHQCWQLIHKANSYLENHDGIEKGSSLLIPNFSNCTHQNREEAVWNVITGLKVKEVEQTALKIPILQKKNIRMVKTHDIKEPIKDSTPDHTSTKITDDFVLYDSSGKEFKDTPTVNDKSLMKAHRKNRLFTIQLGAFSTKKEAIINKQKLELLGIRPYIIKAKVKSKNWFRVRVGSFSTIIQAKEYAHKKKLALFTNKKYFILNKNI